jgi:hypothetical protein
MGARIQNVRKLYAFLTTPISRKRLKLAGAFGRKE